MSACEAARPVAAIGRAEDFGSRPAGSRALKQLRDSRSAFAGDDRITPFVVNGLPVPLGQKLYMASLRRTGSGESTASLFSSIFCLSYTAAPPDNQSLCLRPVRNAVSPAGPSLLRHQLFHLTRVLCPHRTSLLRRSLNPSKVHPHCCALLRPRRQHSGSPSRAQAAL